MAAGPDTVLAAVRDHADVPAAEDVPPRTSLWKRVAHWLLGEVEDPRHLSRLSDHLLRDIGLSRAHAQDLLERSRDPRF